MQYSLYRRRNVRYPGISRKHRTTVSRFFTIFDNAKTQKVPISFQITQTINCPIEKVYAFLSNFSHMPMWNYYIQSVTKISDGPVAIGTVFEQIRPHDIYRYKIITLHQLQTIVAELQPPGPLVHYGFNMEPQGEGTLVTLSFTLSLENYKLLRYLPDGLIKNALLWFVKKPLLNKTKTAMAQNFSKLKTLLETGEVTLQSGKVVSLS